MLRRLVWAAVLTFLSIVPCLAQVRSLHEENLRIAAEYVCNTSLLQLERANILAEMNGTPPPGGYDAVITKATECIKTIGNTLAYHSRAMAYSKKGDHKAAFADFEKAISAAKTETGPIPSLNKIYSDRADLYIRLGDRAKAEADLREATRLNPSDAETKEKLAKLDEKIAEARKAAAIANPRSADDYLIAGTDNLDHGKYDNAVIAFDRSIALSPSSGAYFGKAKALHWQKLPDAALVELNKALALKPNDGEILEQRGYAYRDLKRWDEAIADFTKALSTAGVKQKSNLLYARGVAYAAKGAYEAALKDQEAALIATDNKYAKVNALDGKGVALQGLGRTAEALAAYDAAVAAAGTDYIAKLYLLNVYLARGKIYASQGKTELAKADFNEIIKVAPDSSQNAKAELAKLSGGGTAETVVTRTAEQWAGEGRRAANARRWDDAIKAFTECIALAANIPACYAFRGAVLGMKGDLSASRVDFDKALVLSKNDPGVLFMRAQMYVELGKKSEAIADFRSVLKIAPGNPQATAALELLGEKP